MRSMISPSGWKLKTAAALSVLTLMMTSVVAAATNLDVKFVNHIDANLPEQDVFVESSDDSTQVVRVEGDQAKDPKILSQKVFAAKQAVDHDPFKIGDSPLGPYPKGKALDFTLEDWLAAEGSGTYTVNTDTARLDLTFQKLVPNGVYTVWCSRLTFPPNPAVVDRPCGAADGSENVFNADAQGNGVFKLSMEPLEESTQETASVIALAYHSDGKTYGVDPGAFGLNSHVQIFYLIPPAQAAESPTPVATAIPTQVGGLSTQALVVIIIGILILVLGWWWYSQKGAKSSGPTTPEV